jgi:ubiquinone/menaquinone biosynthesis C-methylase UbiE
MRDGRRISKRKLTWTELMEMTLHTPVIANATQREKWNTETGSRWLERHAIIDQQIAPFGHQTMDRANIQPGWRVLDVGCGCGETTVELARRVGHSGSVRGVDISAPLIEAARALAQKSDLRNVRFDEADAQTFLFSAASFDLIFSRFGIMFFDDPDAAFHNLRSALRPGGGLAFACWPAPRENQFVTIPVAAAARHVALPAPGAPDAPGPFAFADADRVRRILSRSDFSAIAIERVTEKVGRMSLEETTDLLFQLGPLDEILAGLDGETKHAIRTDLRAALRQFETSGRVSLDAVAWLVTARAGA